MPDVGSVNVEFTGSVDSLEQAEKKAEALVAKLSSQIAQMAKKDATAGEAFTGVLQGMSSELTNMGFKGEEAFRKNEQGAKRLNGEVSKTAGFFQGISKTAAAFGIGLTLHDAARGMVNFARETLAVGDLMSDLSAQFGISVRLLASVRGELNASGSSLESFATGIRMLQRNLADGVDQTDAQGQALKKLGITSEDAIKGMSDPDGFLLLFAQKLAGVENQTERNAIAFQLMGRSGMQQVPALMALAKGMDEMSEASVAGYKALGDLSDGFVNAKTKLQDFGAGVLANTIRDFKILAIGALMAGEGIARFLSLLPGAQKGMGGIADELQRMRLEDFQGPQSHQEVGKPYTPGPDPKKLKEAQDKLKSYTESLNKQIIGLRAEEIAFRDTEAAAHLFRLQQEALIELGPAGAKSVQGLIDKIVGLTAHMEVMQFDKGLKQQITAIEGQRIALEKGDAAALRFNLAQQAHAKFGNILTSTTVNLIDAIVREAEALQRAQLIAKQHADTVKMLDADYAELGNAAADLEKIEEAWRKNAEAFQKMRLAQAGAAFDQDSTEQGRTGEVNERLGSSLTELDARMFRVQQLSEAMGGSFDSTSAKIAIQKERIEQLTMAYGPFSTEVQEAMGQLQNFTLLKGMEDVIDSAGRGVTMTLEGILTGTQTVEEGFRNLARNVALSMLEMTMQIFLIQPALNALKQSLQGLMGAGSTGTGGGGWISGIGSFIGGLFGGGASAKYGGPVRGNTNISPMLAGLAASLPQYASGGGVPIMAHQGEYVLNRRATEAIGSQALNHINSSGKLPGAQMGKPEFVMNNVTIIPKAPWMTKEDMFQFSMEQAAHRGPIQQMQEARFDRG